MRDGSRGGHDQNSQRGGRDQAYGERKPAHSFPDQHNHNAKNIAQKTQNFPAKPPGQQSPTQQQYSPQNQPRAYYPSHQSAGPSYQQQPSAPPSPQTYQFNGYTFQYGNPAPPQSAAQYQQPPHHHHQQQQQYWQNYQQQYPQAQQSPGAQQFPAGTYVNPAFWAGQQQQQAAQQYPHSQGQGQGQSQGQAQQPDLAEVLRQLGPQGQHQGQGRW